MSECQLSCLCYCVLYDIIGSVIDVRFTRHGNKHTLTNTLREIYQARVGVLRGDLQSRDIIPVTYGHGTRNKDIVYSPIAWLISFCVCV